MLLQYYFYWLLENPSQTIQHIHVSEKSPIVCRQIYAQLRNPESKKASKLLQELTPRDPLLVGIIGCGRLGSHLANSILTFGEINAEELKISTRRPETLSEPTHFSCCQHVDGEYNSSVFVL